MTVRAKSLPPRGTCVACGRLVEWALEDGRALLHLTTVYSSAPDGETAIECPGSGRLVKEVPPPRFDGHCQLVPSRVWTRLSGAPDIEVYLMGDGRVLSRRYDPAVPTVESVYRGEHSINQYRRCHGIPDAFHDGTAPQTD